MSFKLRNTPEVDVHDPVVADDLWHAAEPYTDKASPDQDQRRDELDEMPAPASRAEPDPIDAPPETEPGPMPYVLDGPGPTIRHDPIEVRPDDGQASTHVVDGAQVVADADPSRTSWAVFVPDSQAAGVRLAIGRYATDDAASSHTSIPVPSGATLRGTMTGRIAVASDTPGTTVTVAVITERFGT